MSRKKESSSLPSPAETAQIQSLLENYHQITHQLRESTNQAEIENALSTITQQSENIQITLLKALAKENTIDAADLLTAINVVSPQKEIRKEARRALIQLEASKTYPGWKPPLAHTSSIQVKVEHTPRFWKGLVTQTREEGEVQLSLFWEQGYDYSEVRSIILLLDFWREGVKDAIIETNSKRQTEERINQMRSKLNDIPLAHCTLTEGKHLLTEALSVNEWYGVPPAQSYRTHEPVINRLLLQVVDQEEGQGSTFINPELTEGEVIINFLGAWSMGDFGLAYDLLSTGSTLRDELDRDTWIAQHRAWSKEAQPARMELGFVHERERSQSALWVPTSAMSNRLSTRKEIEIGWSLEVVSTPLSGTLKEMPMGTAVNKETHRHWFWTNYTLVREQEAWRIQSMTDEGAAIQGLSITELQKRIKEYEEIANSKIKEQDIDIQEAAEELAWRLTQILHYYDALIAHLPLDRTIYEETYGRAVAAGNAERGMVYLERMVARFAEKRSEALKSLGAVETTLAYKYPEEQMRSRRDHLLALAEGHFREAIQSEDNALSHLLLAELFLSQGRNDEAQAELQLASTLNPDTKTEAAIEADLGAIAMRQERLTDAITHYKKVAALNGNYPGVWFSLAFAHRLLGQLEVAEQYNLQAIQVEPGDPRAYAELTAIYTQRSEYSRAQELLERGLRITPDSAHLNALLASVLFQMGDQKGAQRYLAEAEGLEPDLDLVQRVRQYISSNRKK